MKKIHFTLLILFLSGCTAPLIKEKAYSGTGPEQTEKDTQSACPGTTNLPPELAGSFEAVEDVSLLNSVLGEPGKGMLCQGKVYEAKSDIDVTVYRAWNSTNPGSRLGKWWASSRPDGKVSQYRSDYEICYQWSPLDKLTHCQLNAGTRIVVGTGQSAECSQYLTYPVSAEQQIYIEDASSSVSDCKDYDALFKWLPDAE